MAKVRTFDELFGVGTDVRAPDLVFAEIMRFEKNGNKISMLDNMSRFTVIENRNNTKFVSFIEKARSPEVNLGKSKGDADRSLVADTLFAQRQAGATPAFFSGDKDVITGLSKLTTPPTVNKGEIAPSAVEMPGIYKDLNFMVNIDGSSLKVMFPHFKPKGQ